MDPTRIMAALALVLIMTSVHGQLSLGPSVYVGRSDFPSDLENAPRRSNESFKSDYGNSYAAGVFAEYQMNEWFSLQLDVLYDQLNFSEETLIIPGHPSPDSQWRYTNERKAEYLSFPVTLQFNYRFLHLNIGYQTSRLLHNHEKRCNLDPIRNECMEGESLTLTDWNVSFMTGLSCDVYKGVALEFRYVNGIANISDNSSGYNSYRSTSVQYLLGITYRFEFGKKSEEAVDEEMEEE